MSTETNYNNSSNKIIKNNNMDNNIYNNINNEDKIEIRNQIKNNIIKNGKIILKENDFFRDLDMIMENNQFKSFYDKYFKDFSDIKIVILYMKMYETIQKEYREKNNCEIESELLTYIMKELMTDNFSRKNILESFNNFVEGKNDKDKKFILDIFDRKEKGNLIEWK